MRKQKIGFYTSGAGNVTAELIIGKEFVEKMGLSVDERIVDVEYLDGKLIISKSDDQSGSKKKYR